MMMWLLEKSINPARLARIRYCYDQQCCDQHGLKIKTLQLQGWKGKGKRKRKRKKQRQRQSKFVSRLLVLLLTLSKVVVFIITYLLSKRSGSAGVWYLVWTTWSYQKVQSTWCERPGDRTLRYLSHPVKVNKAKPKLPLGDAKGTYILVTTRTPYLPARESTRQPWPQLPRLRA